MKEFYKTALFREAMYYFEWIDPDMPNYKNHIKIAKEFVMFIIESKICESGLPPYIFTENFYPYQQNSYNQNTRLKYAIDAGHFFVYPLKYEKLIVDSIMSGPDTEEAKAVKKSKIAFYVLETIEDAHGENYRPFYIIELTKTLPKGFFHSLIRYIHWDNLISYLFESGKILDIDIQFTDFMCYVWDLSQEMMDSDSSIIAQLSLEPPALTEFVQKAQNEIERNALNQWVYKALGAIMLELVLAFEDDDITVLDPLASTLLYLDKVNDPLYFKNMVNAVLQYGKLEFPYAGVTKYELDVVKFLYGDHLAREKLMCQFHRFIFGPGGRPIEKYNSDIAQDIRNNWNKICKIDESELLL